MRSPLAGRLRPPADNQNYDLAVAALRRRVIGEGLLRTRFRSAVLPYTIPSCLPTRSRISSARSRSLRLWVAVMIVRRRALPWGTVG